MMEIIDDDDKTREVFDLKRVHHDGKEYAKMTVEGKHIEWTLWMELETFRKKNPQVNI